jgi:hypothetical protein
MSGRRHDPAQARVVDRVEPGFYRMRLARGCWRVPCRILRTDDRLYWFSVIDGFEHEPHASPWIAEGVSMIHTYGEKITQRQYDWLLSIKDWATVHEPDHPSLWPQRRMDPLTLRPLSPRKTPKWI